MAAVKTIAAGELPAWQVADLPEPPVWTWGNVLKTIGPGAILLGVSIGSGEWLLGPSTVVMYGLALLWITTVSVVLQVLLNMEFVRYTLYCGEPIFSGFMRLRPGSTFWGWFWVTMYFLQVGWPGWASTGAGALAQMLVGVSGKTDAGMVAWLGILLFMLCVVILAVGQRIERTLELAQWAMIAGIIAFLVFACIAYVNISKWPALIGGFFGYNAATGGFTFIPPGADFLLLGAFAAYSGAGGTINATITNWMRDKGFGMGSVVGFIPSLIGGKAIKLSHTGKVFEPSTDNMRKWNLWWKYAGADQYGLWLIGAFIGMGLPGLLAFNFIKAGTDIRGLAVAAALGNEMYKVGGDLLWFLTLLCGVWILFSTQLGIIDGFVRGCTDMIWTGSKFAREKVADVRIVYYGLLGVMTIWGVFLMALPLLGISLTGIDFIQQGANWAGVNFVFLAVLTIIVNRKFLPKELLPKVWREVAVVLCGLFFAFFALAWLLTSTSGKNQITWVAIYFGLFLIAGLLAYFMRKK